MALKQVKRWHKLVRRRSRVCGLSCGRIKPPFRRQSNNYVICYCWAMAFQHDRQMDWQIVGRICGQNRIASCDAMRFCAAVAETRSYKKCKFNILLLSWQSASKWSYKQVDDYCVEWLISYLFRAASDVQQVWKIDLKTTRLKVPQFELAVRQQNQRKVALAHTCFEMSAAKWIFVTCTARWRRCLFRNDFKSLFMS